MRLAALLCLASYFAAGQADLQHQDLHAIQAVFKKQDVALDWFSVMARKAIDAERSVMVVEAAKGAPSIREMQIGVFVVSGMENRVERVLDTYPAGKVDAAPTLELPDSHTAYLHFYSDYGFYCGSIKYVYDLASGRPARKFAYHIVALTSATRQNGNLRYTATGDNHAIVTIEPAVGDAPPSYKFVVVPAPRETVRENALLHTASGMAVSIVNQTPPGQSHTPGGIRVGEKQFYPVPVPTLALHRKILPSKQTPGEMENDIGPFFLDGDRIWFANTFYDSEGVSGVGAIGSFDIATRKYEMRYLPEIAPWSGSAILLDGDSLWIGLMRRPEGSNYGTGLIRYNTKTGAVAKYDVKDYIYTIDSIDGTIYCGTSHGLYTIRDEKVTQYRFEPDSSGKLSLIMMR